MERAQLFAVVAVIPDNSWVENYHGPATPQQEWRAIFSGTWTECQSFNSLWHSNVVTRGCSIGFTYTVRMRTALELVGKLHNTVTFGGYFNDAKPEPTPDAPPDMLHIAATYAGDHYENFAVAACGPTGKYYAADLPWYDSFAEAWAAAAEWRKTFPQVQTFVTYITCAQELDDYGSGTLVEPIWIHEGKFEHWVWEEGQVAVKYHTL